MPLLNRLTNGIFAAVAASVKSSPKGISLRSSYEQDVFRSSGLTALAPDNRMCGAAGCTNGWAKPWKARRRPIFEDDWGCGTRCLEGMVGLAIARLSGEGSDTREEE